MAKEASLARRARRGSGLRDYKETASNLYLAIIVTLPLAVSVQVTQTHYAPKTKRIFYSKPQHTHL